MATIRAIVSSSWLLIATAFLVMPLLAEEKKSQSDEDAIRATVESYVTAYNRGDAQAVAKHWSESGEWISPTGEKFTGSEEIGKALKNIFAQNVGGSLKVKDLAIRLVSADVAVEDGTVVVMSPNDSPYESTYVAIHVKQGGQWKLDSIRETEVADAPPVSGPLQDLAWLVGEWSDADAESGTETHVTWTKNKTFLNYSFKTSLPGMDDLEGTQVIGWDPNAGMIRSWMFDSDGGMGEGVWSQRGNSWIVKFSQVLPDGRTASSTNIYTLIDVNKFTWSSIGRKVGDEFLPNLENVVIVRKGTGDAKPEKENSPQSPSKEKVAKPMVKQPEKAAKPENPPAKKAAAGK